MLSASRNSKTKKRKIQIRNTSKLLKREEMGSLSFEHELLGNFKFSMTLCCNRNIKFLKMCSCAGAHFQAII
jgi:hypothetical protein